MTWRYQISTGELYHGETFFGSGYSGRAGECRNNPSHIDDHGCGPIPIGYWSIGPEYTDNERGPIVMRLSPWDEKQTFGRSGFLIHGDNKTHDASTGCIILGPTIRKQISESGDKVLEVIA